MEEQEIYEKLRKVQGEITVPKGQYNKFGKYPYRSAEDILAAATPLLVKNDLTMVVNDIINEIGGKIYVESTVLINGIVVGCASAREADEQKGMSPAQITGSTSSYSRKYALNGVFLLDDVKDNDHDSNHPKYESKPAAKSATKAAAVDW